MKKIIIAILCIILSGTIYFFIMRDKKINNENKEHKNFKQTLIRSDGTIYGEKDRDWQLEFNIVDDDINNELVLNKNIEDIYILENNNTKINLKNYEIIDNQKEEKYVLRKLKCEFDNKYGDKINLNKLVIKYLDEKEKEFNIGNLNLENKNSGENKTNYKLAYDNSQNLIPIVDERIDFSGMVIKLGEQNYKKINVEKINLDVEGIGIDYNNIKVINNYDEKNKVQNNIINNTKYIIGNKNDEEFKGLNLDFGDSKMVCIVLPFKFNENFEKEKIIYNINPKLTLEANGVEEILINDNGISNDFMFDGDNLLDEEKLIEQLNREGI